MSSLAKLLNTFRDVCDIKESIVFPHRTVCIVYFTENIYLLTSVVDLCTPTGTAIIKLAVTWRYYLINFT